MNEGSFLIWDKDPEEVANNPPRGSAWYRYYAGDKKTYKPLDVKWVTEPSEERLDRSTILAYGNRASLAYYYHQLCVVAFTPQERRMGESKDGDEDESMDGDEDFE